MLSRHAESRSGWRGHQKETHDVFETTGASVPERLDWRWRDPKGMAELSARMETKTGTLPVSLGDKGVPGKYPRTRRESVAKPKKITSRIQRVVSAEAGGSKQGVCDPSPQVE